MPLQKFLSIIFTDLIFILGALYAPEAFVLYVLTPIVVLGFIALLITKQSIHKNPKWYYLYDIGTDILIVWVFFITNYHFLMWMYLFVTALKFRKRTQNEN